MIACLLCGVERDGRRGEVCSKDLNAHLLVKGFEENVTHIWGEAKIAAPWFSKGAIR